MPCNFPFAVGATAISLRETRKIAVYFNSCLHLWHFIFALQKRSHLEQQKPFRNGTVFLCLAIFRSLSERQRFRCAKPVKSPCILIRACTYGISFLLCKNAHIWSNKNHSVKKRFLCPAHSVNFGSDSDFIRKPRKPLCFCRRRMIAMPYIRFIRKTFNAIYSFKTTFVLWSLYL